MAPEIVKNRPLHPIDLVVELELSYLQMLIRTTVDNSIYYSSVQPHALSLCYAPNQ